MEMSQLCANFPRLSQSFHFARSSRLRGVSSCSALHRFAPICNSVDATSQAPNFSLFRCRANPQQTFFPSSSTCHLLFCFHPGCHQHPLVPGMWLQSLHWNGELSRCCEEGPSALIVLILPLSLSRSKKKSTRKRVSVSFY